MAVTSSVTITSHADEIKKLTDSQVDAILTAIGFQAETYAKENCPVDTGRLRNSITHETDSNAVYIGSNVEYAPAVELKDMRHTTGKAHFLRDALQDHASEYENIIEQGLKSALG